MVLSAAVALIGACGTDAVGVETCRQVEYARCARAKECGIDLERPLRGGDVSDVKACELYYRDACLHGLSSGKDPGAPQLAACVDTLRTTPDCEVVKAPEKAGACAWLVPSASPTPAPADAASDALAE